MPIMRNPFRKQDENVRPATYGAERGVNGAAPEPIDIKEREATEYKLSGKSHATLQYRKGCVLTP